MSSASWPFENIVPMLPVVQTCDEVSKAALPIARKAGSYFDGLLVTDGLGLVEGVGVGLGVSVLGVVTSPIS